jgi:hypothetical protein
MVSAGGKIVEAGAMTDGQIVVGKTGAAPQLVTLSGDVSVSNTGVSTIGAIGGKVLNGALNTSDKIMYYDQSADRFEIVGLPTCGANEYLTFNGTAWSCVADAGAAGTVSSMAGNHPLTVNQGTGAVTMSLNYDTAQFDLSTNLLHLKALGITNAEIATAAAIARTKLASGTADHVLINDGTGVMSSEAQLAISRGGTGQSTKTAGFDALSPNTTKGDVIVHDGTNNVRLPAGTDTHVLIADSTQAAGVKWGALPAAPGDASYAAKGVVQFNTDATTSGMTVAAGVATVNKGGGIGQIAQVGSIALGNNGVIVSNATGTSLLSLNCTIGQTIKFDASGFAGCGADNDSTPGDASYVAKGILQADTDAPTSGLVFSAAGVLKVNFGTGNDQIVKLDGSAKLQAVDGSALTNMNTNTSINNNYFKQS